MRRRWCCSRSAAGSWAPAGRTTWASPSPPGLLVYENAIISPSDMSRVNAAFFNVNGMVAVVVLLGAIADRLLA